MLCGFLFSPSLPFTLTLSYHFFTLSLLKRLTEALKLWMSNSPSTSTFLYTKLSSFSLCSHSLDSQKRRKLFPPLSFTMHNNNKKISNEKSFLGFETEKKNNLMSVVFSLYKHICVVSMTLSSIRKQILLLLTWDKNSNNFCLLKHFHFEEKNKRRKA